MAKFFHRLPRASFCVRRKVFFYTTIINAEELICAGGLSENDIIHFSRTIRSAMHGFVTLEEAGFFGTAVDADESYSYMVKALLQPLKTELGRISDGKYELYCFGIRVHWHR